VPAKLPFDVRILAEQLLARVQTQVEAIATTGLGLVGTFNWFLDLILILVISFYMLVDGERVWHGLTSIFRPKSRDGNRTIATQSAAVCLWSVVVGAV